LWITLKVVDGKKLTDFDCVDDADRLQILTDSVASWARLIGSHTEAEKNKEYKQTVTKD